MPPAEMTLEQVLNSLETLSDEWTIFAEKTDSETWGPASRAWLVAANFTVSSPHYFLEVAVAKEVLDGWSRYQLKRKPSPAEIVARIIQYATYDA